MMGKQEHEVQDPADVRFRRWLEVFFIPTVESAVTEDRIWCPQWWKHPEAVDRMHALWVAHTAAMKEPATLSDWWLRHFDYHMQIITDRRGIFALCQSGQHVERLTGRRMSMDFMPPEDYAFPIAYHQS